jgi:enoyl-[acyl-carrier protein] reductase II
MLSLKKSGPVRMLKNRFWEQLKQLEDSGATPDQLAELLGKGRAKRGIFEGDLAEGELEIGQAAALVDEIQPVSAILEKIIQEFNQTAGKLSTLNF